MDQIKDATLERQKSLNRPLFFIITAIVGLIIAGIVFIYYQSTYDVIHTSEKRLILSVLSNCFFVSGVFVGGLGALVLISSEGFFDMIIYGTTKLFSYIFVAKEKRNNEKYIDYKLRREGERGGGKIWFIAAVGGVIILIAFFFAIPFFNVSNKTITNGYDKAVEMIKTNYDEDINVVEVNYVYMKFSTQNQKYNGTITYDIMYKVGSNTEPLHRYYVLYIDSKELVASSFDGYMTLYNDYETSNSAHGKLKLD